MPVDKEILQRRWRCLGHTLRKPPSKITRQALAWNPHEKRKRGRPCNSWRRDLEADVKSTGKNCKELERKQHRTESYGDNLLAAYAPGGVKGLSK